MDDIQVVTIGIQGPPGVSGSSVPATTTTLGGVIVGNNLTVLANGLLSANFIATSNLPWANITGKPTFANVATSGLYTDLTGTPNLSVYLTTTAASATYALISSLASYLTTANASTTYSVLGHTHTIANVINLQSTLDGKQPSGSYVLTSNSALTDARTPLAHTQAWSTITGTPTLLGAGGYGITDGLTAATAASTYLTSADANNAFVPKTISVIAGTGLTGGGALNVCRTLTLATSGATAGTYGSATTVPQVTVDTYGRITGVTNVAITAGGSYTLPIATTSTLGGVRQGSGVVIDPATGILSISGSGGGTVTSVTGSTGITVTACTTAPVVSIDSTVATLTGTQTLTNKSIPGAIISDACLTTSISCNSAPIRRGGTQRENYSTNADWTVIEGVCGALFVCTNTSDITVTLPTGLSSGFNLSVIQAGTGRVTIAAASGVTLYGRNGLKTAAQYAVIGVISVVAQNTFIVTGDTIV